jgi:hypothetical protein
VLDSRGRPVPGAQVALAPKDEASDTTWWASDVEVVGADSPLPLRCVSDADGSFRFAAVPARRRLLLAAWVAEPPTGSVFDPTLSLQRGEQRADVELRFEPVRLTAGTVRSVDGRPLEGVRVESEVGDAGALLPGATTLSAPDGSFELALGGGDRCRLSFRLDGHAEERRFLRLAAQGPMDLEVVLQPASEVLGWVLDEQGRGVGGMHVEALRLDGTEKTERRATRSDELGFFVLEDLEDGPWRLRPKGLGYTALEDLRCELPLASGAGGVLSLLVRESLPPERALIEGEVVDSKQSEAVEGLRIDHRRGGSLLLDGARFRLFGFAPGRMSLVLSAPGMETTWIEQDLVAAGEHIDLGLIEMRPATRLRVHVADSAGRALKDVRVRLVARPLARGGWSGRKKQILLEEEGKGWYRAESVPRAAWRLEVGHPQHADHRRELSVRGRRQELRVGLEPAAGGPR